MDLKSLENQALDLSPKERAQLAFELIESLEILPPAEIEALWAQEAQRRAEQIDTEAVPLASSEVVSAQAHALLR
jgi:hypothetical protein